MGGNASAARMESRFTITDAPDQAQAPLPNTSIVTDY